MSKQYKTTLMNNGLAISTAKDGEVQIASQVSSKLLVKTTAADLAYMLQVYQDDWGGIPVRLDLDSFRGVRGEPG